MANCQNNMRYGRSGTYNQCEDMMPLAMAYVPWQDWRQLYEPHKALQRGTLFEELDKPFKGRRRM